MPSQSDAPNREQGLPVSRLACYILTARDRSTVPPMLRALTRLLRVPDKLAMLALVRGMTGQVRLATASALLRSGVFEALREPRSLDELVEAVGAQDAALLRNLLDLGVQRGLLRRRGAHYAAKGALARTLVREPDGPLASMLAEVTTYHQEVFQGLDERLSTGASPPYLERYGELVARSSRIMAPWIEAFSAEAIGVDRPRRILELGCGTGAYLEHYGRLHDGHSGVGIDFDTAVVAAAEDRMCLAYPMERFTVVAGDMRDAATWPVGPFDVITAHQNVYYFDSDERREVWRSCRGHLADDGRLVIVSAFAGGPMSDYFALILGSTQGCRALPTVDAVVEELRGAGFEVVRRERMIPGDAVWGIEARATPAAARER